MSERLYRFEQKWKLGTGIGWWDESRAELNKIIEVYNTWQVDDRPEDEKRRLVALIEMGRQTIGAQDGGSGYLEVLDRMLAEVEGGH